MIQMRIIVSLLIKIVERHTPLKKKFLKGNQDPFMNKELRKKIYTRSRSKNHFCKSLSKENEKRYKIQRNRCVSLRKKSIKKYFNNISKDCVISNKNFWSMIKPFLTNKVHINREEVILKTDEIIQIARC